LQASVDVLRHGLTRTGLRLATALTLLALVGQAAAAPIAIPVDQFRPTQHTIGKASAMLSLDQWKRDAAQRHMSLAEYARTVLQPALEKRVVPAVIDPRGRMRNTDAHHRIAALLALQQETGVVLTLKTDVVVDYRGQSERAFATDFVDRLKKGWFEPKVRRRSPLAMVRSLPLSFAQLGDDPLRSSIDTAFDKLGLSGGMFSDYVEFRVGEMLVARGLLHRLRARGLIGKKDKNIPPDRVFSPRVVDEIVAALREPEMRELLVTHARNPSMVGPIQTALGGS
jgi:hypothetical protein